jgi:glycosyltransferase involved in cell wall biosynthesis
MASISFVCPLFNKVAYLPGVIAALEQQAPSHDKQFIFIDDGSTDGSLDLVRELTEGWTNCIYRYQDNTGPAGSTNAGLALAEGDYVKLLGSDDILAPFATDILLHVLEDTGAVAVYSKQSYYTQPTDILFPDKDMAPPAHLLTEPLSIVIGQTISGTSQTLFRSAAVRNAGGCDSRVFAEDYSLALRLARQGSIATLDFVTAYGPADQGDRIMVGRKHQVFHDYNLALQLFFEDFPELKSRYGRLALHRAAGRAEKWVRREGGGETSPFPFTLLRLAAYFPGLDHAKRIAATLPAFTFGPQARSRGIILPKSSPSS